LKFLILFVIMKCSNFQKELMDKWWKWNGNQ
jgi:hypothetical protein